MSDNTSPQTQTDASRIAKATQKPGQTKEQTKLIAQGIEKGISEYKKQQKIKARERDKQRKKMVKKPIEINDESTENIEGRNNNDETSKKQYLPWLLLVLTWFSFIVYFFQ